jgi:hypothetical protein
MVNREWTQIDTNKAELNAPPLRVDSRLQISRPTIRRPSAKEWNRQWTPIRPVLIAPPLRVHSRQFAVCKSPVRRSGVPAPKGSARGTFFFWIK